MASCRVACPRLKMVLPGACDFFFGERGRGGLKCVPIHNTVPFYVYTENGALTHAAHLGRKCKNIVDTVNITTAP